MHVDTGHNFPEALQFRDDLADKLGVRLIVGSVQESIDKGRVAEEREKCYAKCIANHHAFRCH